MSFLVDTNILLRSIESLHPHFSVAVSAVSRLLADGTPVYFALQNIAEFWNVATRPRNKNGLGLTIPAVLAEVEKIEGLLTLLPDTPAVYSEWKRLIVDHNVSGVQVHDARLVATMKTNGVTGLLTFDVGDFSRYPGIDVTHPQAIAVV
jgi:predicted nucleic acid-binding protein